MDATGSRRSDIQGLRAVAVFLVVAHHAGLTLQGGFIGVDVFFVISGFVIARLLLTELEQVGDISLLTFYARRARRLLPALAFLLFVVCLISGLLLGPLGPQQESAQTGLGASTFTANLQLFLSPKGYFDADTRANVLLHTWSLSVEEQFYFAFPIALLIAWRIGRRFGAHHRQVVAGLVLATSAVSFAVSWYTSHGHFSTIAHRLGGGTSELAFYAPVTRVWEFGAGIVVAVLAPTVRSRAVATGLGCAGLALLVLGAFTISTTDPFPGVVALEPVIGTVLLLLAGTHPQALTTRLLCVRPLVLVGDISYGWYLWHWPLLVFAVTLFPDQAWLPTAAAFAGLVPGWLSYRFIENPLRAKDRSSNVRGLVIGAVCIAIGVGSALGLGVIARLEVQTEPVRFLATALEPHANQTRGCSNGSLLGTQGLAGCVWPAEPDAGRIYLVGDSNAGHFTEPAAAAAAAVRSSFVVSTRSSCPFADVLARIPKRDARACRHFVMDTVDKLVREHPRLVIIASASTSYVNNADIVFVDPVTGETATSTEAKLRLWQAGVRSVAAKLANAGIPTVIVHAVPLLEGLALVRCPFIRIRHDVRTCGRTVPREAVERQQAAVRAGERAAVAALPGVTTVDFTDVFCTTTECGALRNNDWIYRDAGHLTVRGVRELTPHFVRMFEAR